MMSSCIWHGCMCVRACSNLRAPNPVTIPHRGSGSWTEYLWIDSLWTMERDIELTGRQTSRSIWDLLRQFDDGYIIEWIVSSVFVMHPNTGQRNFVILCARLALIKQVQYCPKHKRWPRIPSCEWYQWTRTYIHFTSFTYCSKQCPAVKTWWPVIKVPPQLTRFSVVIRLPVLGRFLVCEVCLSMNTTYHGYFW